MPGFNLLPSPSSSTSSAFNSPPKEDMLRLIRDQHPSIKLTVYLDPICVWSYLNDLEMRRAMDEAYLDYDFDVEYKPVFLFPCLCKDTLVDMDDVCTSLKKSEESRTRMRNCVQEICDRIGVTLVENLKVRHSMMAQRLIRRAGQLAGEQGQQELVSMILKKIHEEGADVGCMGFLSECASSCGIMCKEAAVAFLASPQLEEDIVKEVINARLNGVAGVPFVVINDKLAMSGYQPAETYLQTFEKVSWMPSNS